MRFFHPHPVPLPLRERGLLDYRIDLSKSIIPVLRLCGALPLVVGSTSLLSSSPSFVRKRSLLARRDRQRVSLVERAAREVAKPDALQRHRTDIRGDLKRLQQAEESPLLRGVPSAARRGVFARLRNSILPEHATVWRWMED